MSSHVHIRIVSLAAVALGALSSTAVGQAPEYVAIKAGRVITVSGEELTPGVIVIEDGKITAVGTGLEFPASAEVIDAPRATVMPGIILARTRYGLVDFKRTGVNGDQKAASEIYLDTIPFEELLEAGITTACFVPTGRDIPGLAAVYMTAGAPDTRVLDDAAYLDVQSTNKKTLRDALKKATDEIEKVEKARKEWEEKQKKKKAEEEARKKAEGQPEDKTPEDQPEEKPEKPDKDKAPIADPEGGDDEDDTNKEKATPEDATKKTEDDTFKPPPIDPKYQPLVDLIQKKEGAFMMIQVRSAAGLLHVDDVLERYDDLAHVFNIPARRSTDLHHVVATLGEREARIIMRPAVHLLPDTRIRYNLVGELVAAGCEISIIPRADRRKALTDMRQQLASVVRAGLARDDAYRMLTLHPARALGLEDQMGSIQKDRRADLAFFDGDPLDPHTEIRRVLIMGKTVYNADDKK